jgi:hypothetical protein
MGTEYFFVMQQNYPNNKQQKFWHDFEYWYGLPNRHTNIFANRQVVNFQPGMEIVHSQEIAYALRTSIFGDVTLKRELSDLMQNPNVNKIENLVFGYCGYGCSAYSIHILIEHHQLLAGLKNLFIGDIIDSEYPFYHMPQDDDISEILSTYNSLESLHIRTGSNRCSDNGYLRFRSKEGLKHEILKVLRIESTGMSKQTLIDIQNLELPSLEYLELWIGQDNYSENNSIDDLMMILSGEQFPHLKYLGIKNCDFADEVAAELSTSSRMKSLIELDLSMGTLTKKGLMKLVNCVDINSLDTLNLSFNYIDNSTIAYAQSQLKCDLLVEPQQQPSAHPTCLINYNYCKQQTESTL